MKLSPTIWANPSNHQVGLKTLDGPTTQNPHFKRSRGKNMDIRNCPSAKFLGWSFLGEHPFFDNHPRKKVQKERKYCQTFMFEHDFPPSLRRVSGQFFLEGIHCLILILILEKVVFSTTKHPSRRIPTSRASSAAGSEVGNTSAPSSWKLAGDSYTSPASAKPIQTQSWVD